MPVLKPSDVNRLFPDSIPVLRSANFPWQRCLTIKPQYFKTFMPKTESLKDKQGVIRSPFGSSTQAIIQSQLYSQTSVASQVSVLSNANDVRS